MEEGIVTEKTAQELQREIDELHRRQREITERLRDPRGLRKGNVFGGNVRNIGMGGLRPSHVMLQRGVLRRPDDVALEDQPPVKKRLLSTVVKVSDAQTEKGSAEKPAGQLENVPDQTEGKSSVQGTAETEAEEGQINGSRPNLQPNVPVRRDNRRGIRSFTVPDLPPVEPLPRILTKEENPSLIKRNRRMFGALLGTLEKFTQEDRRLSAKPTGELEKVLENQQQDLLDWKNSRREELTKYQKEVGERHLANVEAEIERWQSGASRKNSASLGLENNDDSKVPSEGVRHLKARVSNAEEEDADEDIEDIADDDDLGNVLEEEDAKDHGSEKELKGVVEYLSGDEDATNK